MDQQINLYQPILGAGNPIFSARMVAASVAVFAVSLTGISGFAASRVRRVEQEVAAIENQNALRTAASGRLLATLQPEGGMAALEARLKDLAADIAEQKRILAAVRQGDSDGGVGFSARLEALGRRQPDGLWLSRIMLSTGARQLALTGAANDPALVPEYLSALASEPSLASAQFDRFQLRLPQDGEPRATTIFEVGTPVPAPASGRPST